MTTELNPNKPQDKKIEVHARGGGSDTVYALGIIGAWVYYISRATTPRDKFIGCLKGVAWPAILVHALLEFFEKDEG